MIIWPCNREPGWLMGKDQSMWSTLPLWPMHLRVRKHHPSVTHAVHACSAPVCALWVRACSALVCTVGAACAEHVCGRWRLVAAADALSACQKG